jgi:hypothetical protein
MNNMEARVLATFFVWTAFTIIVVAAMVSHINVDAFAGIVLTIILAGSASGATSAIWKGGKADEEGSAEKAKRRNNVDRVLERLSDQEIEDLRARLIGESSDGEAVSLNELIQRR